MGKYQGYERYKDSGVKWLGEIPEHWQVKRTKFLVNKIGSGKTPKGGSEVYLDSGIMLIRSQNVYDDGFRLDDVVYIDNEIDNLQGNSRVLPNDILLNITGASIGRASIVPTDFLKANVNQHVCIFRPNPKKISPKYLHLLFCSRQGKEQIFSYENGTSREGLNFQQAGNLTFAIPQLDEQEAIAQFLDHKTKQIDDLIGKKKALLEKLDEKRTALISHAVTKGLDPNVPMKDSGIEWLAEIPAHWEVKEMKRIVKKGTTITYGIVQAGADIEGGVPYIRTSDMAGDYLPPDGYLRTSHEIDRSYHRSKVITGDIVVAIRATVGKALPVPPYLDGANLTQGTARIAPGDKVEGRFLLWAINSSNSQQRFNALAKGATFREITLDMLRRFIVPIPPLTEQSKISNYLDNETAKIDALMTKICEGIEKLKEYRTALITNAVTGKIDVRQVPIPKRRYGLIL